MGDSALFILGVPRSGTTLLRTILDSHPHLAVGPECPWIGGNYGKVASFRVLYYSLVNDRQGPVCNFEGVSEADVSRAIGQAISSILNSYAAAKGKKRWLEKTPNHMTEIPFLNQLFPQAKYIHIIRDGRDVACSLFKQRENWGKNLSNRGETVTNTLLNSLQRWCHWLRQFEQWQEEYQLDTCQIRYEDLVREPRPVLEKILEFIEEPWSDEVLTYEGQKHDLPAWESGSRDVARKQQISNEGVGKWKTKFTDTERLIASSFADSMLLRYGYDRSLS
ncbi:MAG: sulfotransferase [Cyanosarcina radialis HA8281-LM2]|jgi:hypothetical protein|nr:sulfotransferase [Cyanosarcina radialis HA8281-LM2]